MATTCAKTAGLAVASAGARPAGKRPHLYFMENFRGIAILLVVISHCYYLAWATSGEHWFGHGPLLSFLTGATALFVFISGFFFHYVSALSRPFPEFLLGKAKALLLPYLVISLVLLAVEQFFPSPMAALASDSVVNTDPVYRILTGRTGPAMWYIPFFFLLCLATPLFRRFAFASPGAQVRALAGLLLLGLILNRSYTDRLNDAGYFAFYYAFGIFCSVHRERFLAVLRRRELPVVALAAIIVLAAAQYGLGWQEEARGHAGIWWQAWDFAYPRKILQILLISALAIRFADRRIPGLSLIADWSFGIFFVHQIPLLMLQPLADRAVLDLPWPRAELFVWAAIVLAMSLALLWAVKALTGSRSRFLVGA